MKIRYHFEKGDKVRIKDGLVEDVEYGGIAVKKDMLDYCGKEATIVKSFGILGHRLDIDNESFVWSNEMLEPIVSKDIRPVDATRLEKEMKSMQMDIVAKATAIKTIRWAPTLNMFCPSCGAEMKEVTP